MTDPIASDLAALRTRLGLTQGAVAARAGVTRSTLNRWECGVHSPRLSQLRRWVAALDTELGITVKEETSG